MKWNIVLVQMLWENGEFKRLIELHIRRYLNRINIGQKPVENPSRSIIVNVELCTKYVEIWRGIEKKFKEADSPATFIMSLTQPENNELMDAVADENYPV